jgi:hypothetical protein
MSVFIVTYDLNEEANRPPLLDDLKKIYPTWAKLSESSYAVETSKTPRQVYDSLEKHIDDNDNLYVVTLSKPFYGRGPKIVNDWLSNNLP